MEDKENPTILLVEDDADISFMISDFLGEEGFKVVVAENGAIALEFLSNKLSPDLILLDMMMPVMDGLQFSKEYRSRAYPLCPIIVTSAAVDIRGRAKEILATGWISKPFALDDLLRLVKKTLGSI